MKTSIYWILTILITLSAAYYQRKTGPTYPKQIDLEVNGVEYGQRLIRSIQIGSGDNVKLSIDDPSISATLYYKRFKTNDDYQSTEFKYYSEPVDSWIMNKVFKMTEDKGFRATLPEQAAAGKVQYYFEIHDKSGTSKYFQDEPIVVRYKDSVPSIYLTPHIFIMFFAMLLSTLAGLMAIGKHKSFKKYGVYSLVLLLLGGMILGPIVQLHAFGALWTGVPFGWDLTDNKTLIAVLFWVWAVMANRKRSRPLITVLAAFMLLLVYSIPHSVLGSELDYSSGEVVQGTILHFLF